MKKALAIILALALVISLCACAEDALPNSADDHSADIHGVDPAAQDDPHEAEQESNPEPDTSPEGQENKDEADILDDMPEPYERKEGTDYYLWSFHDLFTMPFGDAFSFDFDRDTSEEFHEWCESMRDSIPTSLTESANCYSAILRFGLTDEEAREFYVSYKILSDEDMDVILTHDEGAIFARFARPETIVVGERGYTPEWLYYHPTSDWTAVGITAEAVEERVQLYFNIPLTMDATTAFMDKISGFLGHEIIADGSTPDQPRLKNGNIEYDLGLLCEWKLDDFEREGITAEMLEDFLAQIYDEYHSTPEYEYIENVLAKMSDR